MIKMLLKMLFGARKAIQIPVSVENGRKKERSETKAGMPFDHQRLEEYLTGKYDFRYNVLTDETEYRSRNVPEAAFVTVRKREQNSLCMDIQAQGIVCWDRDLNRFLHSNRVQAYHPFTHYLDELPAWDGTDRVDNLARRVSTDELWIGNFHKWMLGVTAQWMGVTGAHANSVAPVLISKNQGRRKSTFCKSLMPPALQHYYTDNVALSAAGQTERKLAEMGIINLDEFDRFSAPKMAYLKNLMQMAHPNMRKPYGRAFLSLPRVASFIATSNRKDLLTDPSGSRRFICVEVDGKIDCSGIDHGQLYAQLKAELQAGARYWFTAEEEKELQRNNRKYYQQHPSEEVFHACFRSPLNGENYESLTAAEIFKRLKRYNPAAMRSTTPMAFGRILSGIGLERKHTKWGNMYLVVGLV